MAFSGCAHDIWDRDFPAAPVLITVKHDGKNVDAVAQTSKQGLSIFSIAPTANRFPIEYHKYLASTIPGEVTAPEQPLPNKPLPFARQLLTEIC